MVCYLNATFDGQGDFGSGDMFLVDKEKDLTCWLRSVNTTFKAQSMKAHARHTAQATYNSSLKLLIRHAIRDAQFQCNQNALLLCCIIFFRAYLNPMAGSIK